MRQNRSLPASADPAMVKAARAITDPKLGNSGASIAWDSMTSPEALSAMFRKASIEIGSEIISSKAEGLLVDQNKRKVLFDSVRLEREQARHMMALETTTPIQRDQLKTVIDHANQLTSDIYRVEKVVTTADGMAIGDATDKLATYMIGPEAKMPEYK
jgi:methionine-rich copper-binding protein CopC